jgi:hypothetical protein
LRPGRSAFAKWSWIRRLKRRNRVKNAQFCGQIKPTITSNNLHLFSTSADVIADSGGAIVAADFEQKLDYRTSAWQTSSDKENKARGDEREKN